MVEKDTFVSILAKIYIRCGSSWKKQKHMKPSLPGAVAEPSSGTQQKMNGHENDVPRENDFDRHPDPDSHFFDDGERRIDFVIVNKSAQLFRERFDKYRDLFEKNLIKEGLQLESCSGHRGNSLLRFTKIHAPWGVLSRYAELLHFKMPVKPVEAWKDRFFEQSSRQAFKRPILRGEKFTATYRLDKEYMFDIPSDKKENFFSQAQRSRIVDHILKRVSYGDSCTDASCIGIDKLIEDGAYEAAYPLHEGKLSPSHSDRTRMQLYTNWASLWRLLDQQPLDDICNYMGAKFAMYFAWLGFYTTLLIPASIAGVVCFIYSIATYPYDPVSNSICTKLYDDVAMCPLCSDHDCDYWLLSSSCIDTFFSYLFDNPSTIFFAIFMSVWSSFFTQFWKRYSVSITYQWDISSLDYYDEIPRPEYLNKLDKNGKKRLNFITRMYEPYVSFWKKRLPYMILSGSLVLFFLSILIGVVFGIIFYRVSVKTALSEDLDPKIGKYSSLISASSASFINVIFIIIFNWVHTKVAYKLTEMELPRTQTEFDNSLTLKLYVLEFVNYYSSLFYIAFIKGRFVRHPGDLYEPGLLNKEQCGLGGCFVELTIQLAFIMIGKQAIFALLEMLQPWFEKKKLEKIINFNPKDILLLPQWEADYPLNNWEATALFYEYLEMIIQFGMVTIFVVAFPLAPLFALINNAFEIRLDARKFLSHYKRPVAVRIKDIGVWFHIINALGKLSILTSALTIAFTSSLVPKTYYYLKNGSLDGFISWSISYYETKNLPQNLTDFIKQNNLSLNSSTTCAYSGLRHPPGGSEQYKPTEEFWEILAYRLIFVVIYHNTILLFDTLLDWIIADVPKKLYRRIRQNTYLTNEFIIAQEAIKTENDNKKSSTI
uniref:Anoctamin n=1 Tax=Tetranychus urticae TaxID=32264 RepID=T1K2V6_TETUR